MRTSATHIETRESVRNAVSALPPSSCQETRARKWYVGGVRSATANRDCDMLGSDTTSFVSSSSILKFWVNRIRGLLVSTSASNNTRLVVATNHISRTVAPGTNEDGDSGPEYGGCGKAGSAVAAIQVLPKGDLPSVVSR